MRALWIGLLALAPILFLATARVSEADSNNAEVELVRDFDEEPTPDEFYIKDLYSHEIVESPFQFAYPSKNKALKITALIEPAQYCRADRNEKNTANANCIKNEVRIHRDDRMEIGTKAWYGFSMKVEAATGGIAERGSIRTVVGQWKEETGGSPFVANRLDNGIPHMTVQDNLCRRFVTVGKDAVERHLGEKQRNELVTFLENSTGQTGFSGYEMKDLMIAALNTNDRRVYGILNFSAETEASTADCESEIKVNIVDLLPSPIGAWVHFSIFVYRDADRKNSKVVVYANGRLMGEASGPIGNDDGSGRNKRTYFKFGAYFDVCNSQGDTIDRTPDVSALKDFAAKNNVRIALCRKNGFDVFIDNFARSETREGADPCLRFPRNGTIQKYCSGFAEQATP